MCGGKKCFVRAPVVVVAGCKREKWRYASAEKTYRYLLLQQTIVCIRKLVD